MQLLVYIMKKTERLPQVLAGFMREGISGTTVLDSQGALQLIHQNQSIRQHLLPLQVHPTTSIRK